MPYVIGIVLSAGVAGFARYVGFDRDRAFYPTVMIVIAAYYVLFAVMSGLLQTVVIESLRATGLWSPLLEFVDSYLQHVDEVGHLFGRILVDCLHRFDNLVD